MNAKKGERPVPQAARVFRTIGEVAADLGIPKHVLRFWEGKFPRVRPMTRGGRRRYYRPEDVDLLRGIHVLLREKRYTIEGVQKILREQGVAHVKQCGAKPAERPSRPWRGRQRDLAHILADLEAGRAILAGDPVVGRLPAGER